MQHIRSQSCMDFAFICGFALSVTVDSDYIPPWNNFKMQLCLPVSESFETS